MTTKEAILNLTQELIQTKGYHSFSYSDLSKRLDIKRASIHYYYPNKEDLGKAVMIMYRENFSKLLESILNNDDADFFEKLDQYFGAFIDISSTNTKICIGGALGAEYITLPEKVQVEVKMFFDNNLEFLEKIILVAIRKGEILVNDTPKELAYYIFSSIEGGLIITRSQNNPKYFITLINSIKSGLTMNNTLQS